MKIQVRPNEAGRLLTADDVHSICRASARSGVEIPDQAARIIASWWQSSGTIGSALASLASGREVEDVLLGLDISATIAAHYRHATLDDKLALDMLGTWFVRKVNDPQHVDYPHHPGYLVDCPACEAKCHCTEGSAECVYPGEHAMAVWA